MNEQILRKMIQKELNEEFSDGSKKFETKRKRNSEVLGYTLMGSPDVKTEIGNLKEDNKINIKIPNDPFDLNEDAKLDSQYKKYKNLAFEGKAKKEFKALIKLLDSKDKALAKTAMGLYKKYMIEFFVKLWDVTREIG